MVSVAQLGRRWTLDDVDALERQTCERYELVDGQIFMMAGGSPEHAAVAVALAYQLYGQLRGTGGCRPK